MKECPKCKSITICGVQYGYNNPEHYDGVSEWRCEECGTRWGRWSNRVLIDGESEKRYGVNRERKGI